MEIALPSALGQELWCATIVLHPTLPRGMDHWDPVITDGLADGREVILFDGRGISASSGTPRNRMEEMADDIAAVIRALGLTQVDLLGFSIGGFQAQEVTLRHPNLVRKWILLGTGPRGGDPTMHPQVLEVAPRPVPTMEDFVFLFFGQSDEAKKAGAQFWVRRHQRIDQDPQSSAAVAQAQIEAHTAYLTPMAGDKPYAYLNRITQPTLVLNGVNDLMIATVNSFYLVQNIPNAQLIIYPDAGHGAQYQYPPEVPPAHDPVLGRVNLARLEHELGLAFEGTWGWMRRQERPWLGRPRTSP